MRTPFRRSLRLLFALLGIGSASTVSADPISDKQKAVAAANAKMVGLQSTAIVETANLIVCSPLPPAKTKSLADSLEKIYDVARKALQYEPKDEPWKGKLTVYIFDERRPFTMFMLQVAKEKGKEPYHVAVRGDEPFVVKGTDVGQKTSEAETAAETGRLLAAALLSAKAGTATQIPDWVRFGFGRAVVARSAGTGSKALNELRAKSRAAVAGGKGRVPAKVEDVWAGGGAEPDVLEASVMDYLAFGPNAATNFPKFLTGFRPSDAVPMPTIDQVLEGMMWKKEDLDKAWKKYVLTGK